mgnify:CR=1 FL=1
MFVRATQRTAQPASLKTLRILDRHDQRLCGGQIAIAIVAKTERGRDMFSFLREVDVERRKVVWPTRQETLQTTLMVLVITVIVAILLFIMDTIFGWVVRQLIGGGS